MRQLQENFWKIGWTDRWSDRLPAKVRDPIKIYYRAATAKKLSNSCSYTVANNNSINAQNI